MLALFFASLRRAFAVPRLRSALSWQFDDQRGFEHWF
jgi:hypothetical protein